uniref:Seven TM Receptor n=2 Tax=Caenorhabditis tropicalis TaxID=1561998 RepID=A0A1I7T212_9PELO
MINSDLEISFDKISFAVSFVVNFVLIYLTLFRINQMCRTYKKMVIIFAICGIIFTLAKVIIRPFSHNYNKCTLFFSLNTYLSQSVVQFLLASSGGLFTIILVLISIQFLYRFLCLLHIKKAYQFDQMSSVIWMIYPLVPGSFYGLSVYFLCIPDKYADDYMKDVVNEYYGMKIENVPRFIMIPYASDNSLRWKNLLFFIFAVLLVWFHYAIMLYCGLKMHFNMKQELKKFSVSNQNLQKQFFYALLVQSLGPTVFLVIPIAPTLLVPLLYPFLNMEIDWQTGWLYSIMGIYPPFDSIAFILIVAEYRKVIIRMWSIR